MKPKAHPSGFYLRIALHYSNATQCNQLTRILSITDLFFPLDHYNAILLQVSKSANTGVGTARHSSAGEHDTALIVVTPVFNHQCIAGQTAWRDRLNLAAQFGHLPY